MDNKIALVTGSSNGIGAGLAKYLSSNNFTVIITYNQNKDKAEEILKEVKDKSPQSEMYHLNLREEKSIEELAGKIESKFNRLDLLICNAGTDYYHESFDEVSLEEWREIFEIKVFGTYLCTKYFRPLLKRSNDPNIITISASLAVRPDPYDPAYSSAAAALNNLSLSMAKELSKDKIRTNIVCPGPVDTNLSYWSVMKSKEPEIFTKFKSTNPLKINTEVNDIGKVITSICDNPQLSGNITYVSGGSQLL